MGNRAAFVLTGPGGHTLHRSSYGAVALDLDLLGGPQAVLPFLRSHAPDASWYPDDMVEAGVLADPDRRLLLLFAWEGPAASHRTRAAALELLRRAWPGWEVRWLYDGQSAMRTHLGLAPQEEPPFAVHPGPALEPGDEELDDPDPLVAVVTVGPGPGSGPGRCHVLADIAAHPVEEGPALLDRLRDAPDHGSHRLRADAGIHVDPERRRVGWWLNTALAHSRTPAALWPGWTVEFWEDRWSEHVRASGGRFAPPAPDRAAALAEVRDEALARWAGPRGDVRARLVASLPHATVGRGFAPAVTAEQAATARAAIEAAYRAADGG
ncbi:hypothetical protein [Streptomyces xanthophaeus]|uniref:Uncharacterized protein n=1 Tax=Streptomyces xanthophaeus TaxID=67385 RepID=A0A919GYF9_9ACTN|nr:hypothetical protein [Streptomyces xanthophaeus]GHI87253.1 hypothetical protein Sxan_46170 [Streptomyces xanthophaeus]